MTMSRNEEELTKNVEILKDYIDKTFPSAIEDMKDSTSYLSQVIQFCDTQHQLAPSTITSSMVHETEQYLEDSLNSVSLNVEHCALQITECLQIQMTEVEELKTKVDVLRQQIQLRRLSPHSHHHENWFKRISKPPLEGLVVTHIEPTETSVLNHHHHRLRSSLWEQMALLNDDDDGIDDDTHPLEKDIHLPHQAGEKENPALVHDVETMQING